MMGHRKRLLLITEPNSYRIAAFLRAASEMGIDVLIASRGHYSLVSEVHDGLNIDLSDPDSAFSSILHQAGITPFNGVLGADDSTVELAAKVAQALELPHNPPAAARLTRRKDLARIHLADAGCQIPPFWLIDLNSPLQPQGEQVKYPCVLKPLALSASRGVIRVNTVNEFVATSRRIETILAEVPDLYERHHLLAESYISGSEVAFEGFLHRGELHTLVIFDKPDPLAGPYFEETIYVTPSRLPTRLQATIRRQVALACKAYGLTTGPVHAELRVNGDQAWILEVAARTIGGDCSRSLDNGDDFNLEKLVISLAMDEDYEISPPVEARGVMMIPIRERGILRRVEGLIEASRTEHVENIDIVIRPGNELIPLPEGNQYPGYIFARAESPEKVEAALRVAFEKLNFVVAPVFDTMVTGQP
jgi:biotin carboxylase